ncbi:MAG: hypothetical protein JNL01_15290 [Bdellovibrionales bacterium]|nr:hypothetical protein [Bdellovibrionales bacterium]
MLRIRDFPVTKTLASLTALVSFAACTSGGGPAVPVGGLPGTNPATVIPTPATPIITVPATSPALNNQTSLTLSGTCTSSLTVFLSGDDTQNVICASGSFSFTIPESVDGIYNYQLVEKNSLGQTSAAATQIWNRDTAAPSTPTLTVPASNPFVSGDTVLTISGACETGATVNLSGDTISTQTCTASAYSFTSTKSVDATYNYSIAQTDPAGNTSGALAFQWTRNSAIPPTPVVTTPSTNPFYGSSANLTIAGTCVNGNTVKLSGDSTQNMVCSGSAFSFNVNKPSDATYNFSILQTSVALVDSASATLQWTKDSVAPALVVVTTPASSPISTALTTQVISGTCENGATVAISGSMTGSQVCSGSAFSFTASPGADGTFNYTLKQTDLALNNSGNTNIQWTRDTSIPSTPVITSPASTPFYSNAGSVTISGTCSTGLNVKLAGASTQNMTCSGGAFSFNVPKGTDGTYAFSVSQVNAVLTSSAAASMDWVRDTVTPPDPTLTMPGSNPFISGGSSVTIGGNCQIGATVSISGDLVSSTPCSTGTYSFVSNQSVDATYSYTILQTDLAGNASSGFLFQWARDNSLPPTPVLTSPSSNPYYSQGGSLTIAGSCVDGNTVYVTGDSTQNAVCASSSFSFNVSKSDGTYNFSIYQQSASLIDSGSVALTWVRDSVAPSPIILTTPSSSPYLSGNATLVMSGTCETGATVNLTGSSTQNQICVGSAFSFNYSPGADGTYNFTLKQTDLASNQSSAVALQWIRDSAVPSSPLVLVPSTNPYYSSAGSLTISGNCTTGYTVSLSGADTQSMTCASSAFSFNVTKSTDATYNFNVIQTNPANMADSAPAAVSWIRDTVIPSSVVLASTSPSTQPSSTQAPKILGTADAGTTVRLYLTNNCSGGISATGSAATLASPGISLTVTAQATSSISSDSVDAAGNVSACSNVLTYQHRSIQLISDIRSTAGDSSSPSNMIVMGGSTMYFRANDGILGAELWKTDGSVAGTVLVKDINPSGDSNPATPVAVGSTFYFAADDGTNGTELWKSDGTAAGTVMVADIASGGASSSPTLLTVVGTNVFFVADDGVNGAELWVTDGTTTTMLADIGPGSASGTVTLLTAMGGNLYFSANDTVNGTELWKSDGTPGGTALLKDINPGAGNGTPTSLTAMGGALYFAANEATNGTELWKSDGTTGGTAILKNIRAGTASSSPTNFVVMNGTTLLFSANDGTGAELHQTDGTLAGTALVKNINTTTGTASSSPANMRDSGSGFIYFTANDGVNGLELWKSDGTSGGTTLIKDLYTGATGMTVSAATVTVQNGKYLWRCTIDATAGAETCYSDGTSGGTYRLIDSNAGIGNGNGTSFTYLNGSYFFSAMNTTKGTEMFKSDGTPGGTAILTDLNALSSSGLAQMVWLPTGIAVFSANDGVNGAELWKTNGSGAGTANVKDINPGAGIGSGITNMTVSGNFGFFSANDGTNGQELWVTDGSNGGTVLLKDINPGSLNSSPGNLKDVNGTLFFSAADTGSTNCSGAACGTELWKSDGTIAGTVLVKDIRTGAGSSSSPSNLVNFGGTLFFSASDGTNGTELWKSDGTSAGTVMVSNINAGSANSSPQQMMVVGSTLYFSAVTSAAGRELWKTDGTGGGTVLVKDIESGTGNSTPTNMTAVGSNLFFTATTVASGTELYVSDGTSGGTVMVKEIRAGAAGSSPGSLVAMGGKLYFSANDGVNGAELWTSDGTSAGTVMVKNIRAGSGSSSPSNFRVIGSILYFQANNGVNGNELWRSDGTAAGTFMVQDMNPTGNGSPGNMTDAGATGTLIFSVNNGTIGTELYMY